ncbi:Gaa1-like protein [Protomyces lactucae-debilis]|uniref:Gaa1-like protein n=1 Tax=Protomyces lactucae-debilis TaxID=2754530 RepID=A0A1Y2F1E9_PROLT|nr:Gaa1-like protein [Protomyces lactucae-debilis]ORY77698.1 Gaa1-like protein [Protomyces lactucae-debilis]
MGLAAYILTDAGRQKLFSFLKKRVYYISTFLFIAGLAWLAALPYDELNIPTRISENALLPGQVQTHFGHSDYKVLNAFRNEIRAWQQDRSDETRLAGIEGIFQRAGLKTARQSYNVSFGDKQIAGTNVYALLEAPRGDATEALVLNAAWKDERGIVNEGGVTALLAMARYFKRWGLWSKDLLFVIPAEKVYGSQAFIDAYHENHDARQVETLSLTSGVIHAAVDLAWYGDSNRYRDINIHYEGTNGQLANLDLVNSAIHISKHQTGIDARIQHVRGNEELYQSKLLSMLRAMATQATGLPSGSHSPYIPYKIDTISLEVNGQPDGWHDDSSLGRITESIFRSLNNILEHLHASFFFYMLINTHRFVSIGTYLPSAMLIAIAFTLAGLSLYLRSHLPAPAVITSEKTMETHSAQVQKEQRIITVPSSSSDISGFDKLYPAILIGSLHILGIILWNGILLVQQTIRNTVATKMFLVYILSLELILPTLVGNFRPLSKAQTTLASALSLLVLGLCLAALATINFSLSLAMGVLCFPILFARPSASLPVRLAGRVILLLTSPLAVFTGACFLMDLKMDDVLSMVTFSYVHLHVWTPLAIWGVWWPAYMLGSLVIFS